MNAFRYLLPLVLLSCGACSIIGGGERDNISIYSPEVSVKTDPAWPTVSWSLVVARPTAARVIDSPRIMVRPAPGELQIYKGAAWSQPATHMVQDAVLQTLEDSGRIGAVANSETGILGDYKLVMDVRRFEADYAGNTIPDAVIELNAKLVRINGQRVVASRTFQVAQTAASTQTAQVADAFTLALEKLTPEIVGWTLNSGQNDTLAHPVTR
ncbi:ABC-type transport auxiliary lipoprotein family protein [Pseudoxanthomonas dokdonensis]|uniref:ABC transporter n=1 Tax=Pseudoxanthomonas dokdonensis TaxID=344882 RepID=A0A0R0CI87_9GAMM|nr:ABC-type transport auxiliary lipoprotein family protein [Pseudoxanthomonas dokdonensis]KRG69629.1 ABC transporter [Pseudoxanthomonas dokdonensis]